MMHTIQAQIAENNVTVQAQIETAVAPSSGVEVEPFSTSKNGTFTAPQGKAYSPVSVSVPQTDVIPLSVNENGTTEAPAGTAYNPVSVAVPIKTEEALTVEQNGTYTPESGKVYNQVVANVPNTYTAQDESKVVNNGALTAQTARTLTQNDTVDTTLNNSVTVNVPWLMQGPNPVENLGVIYEEETALKDTGYATWTPSTTQTTIKQFANAQPFTIDMQNYEYTLLSQFDFTGVYAENTEQKMLTYRLLYVNLANIYLKPADKTDVIANNFNTTANQSIQSAAFTFYMDSNGIDSLYNGVSSAIWPAFLAPSISGNTVTPRTMTVYAKCDTTRFSTASAAALDQEKSKIKMRCTLYRTPIGGTVRQMYESLTDLYNNPIVISNQGG